MIHTIADLQIAPPGDVQRALASIDLRGTVYRQMTQDGKRRGLTLAEYEMEMENLKPVRCHSCDGEGSITHRPRGVGSIHASSAHRCRLKLYHDVVATFSPEEVISAELQFIFQIGHTLHAMIQRALHKALPGRFQDEVRVTLVEALVDGSSADGVVTGDLVHYLVEIKTIGDQFKELNKPKEEHILQATIYCKALDLPFMAFLYVHKGSGAMKEYTLPYDDRVYQNWLREKVHPVERALETGQEPVADATKYECAQCGYKSFCGQRLEGGRNPFNRS